MERAESKTLILTFTGFPFAVAALWELDGALEPDMSFGEVESRTRLVHQEHYLLDQADQELSSLVKAVYDFSRTYGPLSHVGTFIAPGPFTSLRAAVALLDGLNMCSAFRAHYWNLFEVLFSKQYVKERILWAVDNGRQSWCIGYMSPRKVTQELVLEVRDDVSQMSLEKFQAHSSQEKDLQENSWDTRLIWRRSSLEDMLDVLKKFAVCVLYEEVMLERKLQGFEEKAVHVA